MRWHHESKLNFFRNAKLPGLSPKARPWNSRAVLGLLNLELSPLMKAGKTPSSSTIIKVTEVTILCLLDSLNTMPRAFLRKEAVKQ